MDAATLYSQLDGSHGRLGICMSQRLIHSLCDAAAAQLGVQRLELTMLGPGRFRVRAELASSWLQFFGSIFLRVLTAGIEVQINEPTATPNSPLLLAYIDTNVIVGVHAIQQIIQRANTAAGFEVLKFERTESRNLISVRSYVALNAMSILAAFAPFGMGAHFEEVNFNVSENVLYLCLGWRHNGASPAGVVARPKQQSESNVNAQPFVDLLNKQIDSRFADLQGSSANIHVELPESLLNELVQRALASQLSPWLSLVGSASVKGKLAVEVKLKA